MKSKPKFAYFSILSMSKSTTLRGVISPLSRAIQSISVRFAKESMLVKDYSLSVPLKQKALVPQSISGSVVSAANKPNTEEPEPLMEA